MIWIIYASALLRHGGCPLLAQSGHTELHGTCPLLGVKRTSHWLVAMSAYDPKRTSGPLAETFQREVIHTWHRIGGYDTLARLSLKYLVFEFIIGAFSSYQSAATVTFEPGSDVLGLSTST